MFYILKRPLFVLLTVLGATTVGLTAAGFFANDRNQTFTKVSNCGTSANSFIVHEWGTFTSFSGSDGVKLEFRPLLNSDLPPFVFDRARQSGQNLMWTKGLYRVQQRMETPVTYFYVDRPRDIHVRVGFPRGLLTEFYPPVEKMSLPPQVDGRESVENSTLDWGRLQLIPEDRLLPTIGNPDEARTLQRRIVGSLLPPSGYFDHYAYARKTDSALVYSERPADPLNAHAPQGGFFEKFLFYRGIGNFDLPLKLTALSGDRYELSNIGKDPIRGLFLVTVAGDEIRFVYHPAIAPGEKQTLTQLTKVSWVDKLAEDVKTTLVGEGLYEKEAVAMVDTWRSSWFGEQGTRLFYLLPQKATDELLPLTIEPAPDKTVRVMVGRMEIMRPEDEAKLTALVLASAQQRAAAEKAANTETAPGVQPAEPAKSPVAASTPEPEKLPEAIAAWGRLAEPALARIHHTAKDPLIRAEAYRLFILARPQ